MKKFKSLILLIFLFQTSFSQNLDTVVCKVYYTFRYTTDPKEKLSQVENLVLSIGKKNSVFESVDRKKYSIAMKQAMATKSFDSVLKIHNTGSPTIYYKFNNQNTVFIADVVNKSRVLVADSLPSISWNISNETKTIKNFKCKKAEITFRGRKYEAWITTDLPFTGGPWKFTDSPGLLLEVKDLKNEFSFSFDRLELNFPVVETISRPDTTSVVTIKQYAELKKDPNFRSNVKIEGNYTPLKKKPTILQVLNPFEK